VRDIRDSEQTPQDQAQDLTLAELGYEDLVVTGTGLKEIYYSFDLPMGWALTKEAEVRLLFSHSPLLDPAQSAITLFFNGEPIASVALDEQNAVSGELVGPLPSGNAMPGRANTILVRAILQLEDPCADPESSSAWLRLDSASSLHLTHHDQAVAGYMDMDYWPMPFSASRDLSDVAFSLPASPSDSEYTDAMRLSSYLGASNRGDNFKPAVALGEAPGVDQAGYHWIVIGRPTRNPLLQTVNADLPQPFTPGTDGIEQQVDDVVLRLPSELDLGYLQSILSPWNEDKVLLVVTGTSDAGVERASKMLVNSDRLWELKGYLALLRDDELISTDTRGLTPSGQMTAIATSLPEAEVVGTATPAPPPAPTQMPPGGEESGGQPAPYSERFPTLVPLIIVLGIAGILVVLGLVYFRSRKGEDKS
jgi:hypothetical protein